MKNPLPATLYVVFRNQSQYETLQRVLNEYKGLIINLQDFSQLDSLQQQESRVINIIKLSNVIQVVCYSLVVVLVAVILSFAVFFLRGIFSTFRKDIQVKKLLGATKLQIIRPFMMIVLYAMLGGFLVAIILAGGSIILCDTYMFQVFNFSLLSFLLSQWIWVIAVLVGEIVLILGLVLMISYHFVATLHKKLR
jgi:cell division protein FtsX